ncbi:hypothetical protein ACFE04_026195 [Oxalis oulophora]
MKPVIEVKQGKLQGEVQKTVLSGNEYYSFKGIPFAKPPVNELRFQPPVPLEKWDGILDATKDGTQCTQIDMADQQLKGSEDCLFINVYTPSLPTVSTKLKPVMVFIHGGGFMAGSGSSVAQSPDFFMDYDVLCVTTNYRLHVFDQILALKWIKENIRKFGGDPENVTLFGESAGAASVHHLMLSPLSKGKTFLNFLFSDSICGFPEHTSYSHDIIQLSTLELSYTDDGPFMRFQNFKYRYICLEGLFHKTILQSGTFNCTWSLTQEPEKHGYVLAKKLGYAGEEDPEKVVEFLRTQSDKKITLAVFEIHGDWKRAYPGKGVSLCFVPSIEKDKQNAVLPDHPEILMKTADPLPLIVGLNDKEGRLALLVVAENIMETLRKDFTNCVKHDIKCDKEKLTTISNKIKQFYLGEKDVGPDTADAIVDLYSDIFFKNFYESFENITKSKCPVYVYEFGFHGKFNFYTKITWCANYMSLCAVYHLSSAGAAHGDELPYLFYKPAFQDTIVEPELTVIKNMCSMWSNFAKTGNPTRGMKPEWKPHTTEKPCYLRIDKDLKLVEEKVTPERIEFWKNLRASESL